MTTPTGRLQFFALEAGDYLERLALLAGRSTPPNADEFVRLARALRGAALMAGLAPFSQATAGLEQIAKAHRDGQWPWDSANLELVAQAIEELKRLTRQAPTWSEPDTDAATALGRTLAAALGERDLPSGPPQPPARSDELQPSVRAFVAREGALIAGSLEHAAQAAELGPVDQRADLVLHRLQPLRGLAALPALSPLPELLDAIELTVRSMHDEALPPGSAAGLRAAGAAVSRLAREIAERGKADGSAPEVTGAAAALLDTFGNDTDVVAIETLFAAGDPGPVLRRGEAHDRAAGLDPTLELISLADRLRQAAEQLVTVDQPVARDLHLFGLAVQLRPLAREARRHRPSLIPLVDAVTGAIRRGAAARAPAVFAARLRDAAASLDRAAANRNPVVLTDDLTAVLAALDALDETALPPPATELPQAPAPEPGETAEPELKTLELEALDARAPEIETIESDRLEVEEEVVSIESLAPAEAPVFGAFEQSFSTWHRLEREAAAAEGARPPVEAPPSPEPLAPQPAPTPLELDVVPIESLLYRGRRALERADVVRRELSDALAAHRAFPELEPLVSELIDLVPLALAE